MQLECRQMKQRTLAMMSGFERYGKKTRRDVVYFHSGAPNCSKAWHLKYVDSAEVSPVARELQAKANAWHIEQGRSLARGDSYRWAGFAALMLAIILVVFCWLGWAK